LRRKNEVDVGLRRRGTAKIQTRSALKSWDRVRKVNFGREKHDAYSRFNWRDCYGRVASGDVAGVDPMVSRKELVDISGQGLCGGWKARDSRKRSRRSPEALTAGGPTLRGWHDLLNVRPKRGELTSGVNFGRHRPSQHIAASIAR
jgi:hypothetical protein